MPRSFVISLGLFVTLVASGARAATPEPRLDPAFPIYCVDDAAGTPLRVQCDTPSTGQGHCFVAPACREGFALDGRTCSQLERTRYCDWRDGEPTLETLTADHVVVHALPDIEPGWYRDEEGRVFQVQFDLNQRFFLGGYWLGTWNEDGPQETGGGGLEMGLRVDILSDDLDNKTRVRMVETSLSIAPFALNASFLKIDSSNDGNAPIFSITTFVGEPERHDVFLTAGWWGELLSIEVSPRGSDRDTFFRILGFGVTWDLWHDADMTSYLRLRGGAALDEILPRIDDGMVAFTPLAYLEGDFTFDDDGFHHLKVSSGYEAIYFDPPGQAGLQGRKRFLNELAYEVILLAINDQPVTLRAAVAGGYRDDLSDPTLNGWELSATAGLRVSLWAPPRDLDAKARAEQRRRERGR